MRRRRRGLGLSMVEMMIAMTGTVIVFGITIVGTQSAFGTWRKTVTGSELERHAVRALDTISASLADASLVTIADDLAAPVGGSSITFQAYEPAADGSAVLGVATTIAWESDPEDAEDDVDNDGDGLVDEGRIVRTDADGRRAVIVNNVTSLLDGESSGGVDDNGNGLIDERGFALELDGRRLTLRVTLQKRSPEGEIVTRSAECAVRLSD